MSTVTEHLRLARMELRHAALKVGAISNRRRRGDARDYETALAQLEERARAFVRAEQNVKAAEERDRLEAEAHAEQRRAEARAGLHVIPGGESQ